MSHVQKHFVYKWVKVEWVDGWMKCVYQHAQGGKRLHEAGCRPEQGEAEAEESQSMQQIKTHADTTEHSCAVTQQQH